MTSVLRSGARRPWRKPLRWRYTAFIAAHGDLEDDAGRVSIRHGHHRERQVQTGIGPVAVRCPRVRDRGGSGEAGKIRPRRLPYLRRAKSIEELLPWLYLKGSYCQKLVTRSSRPSTISREAVRSVETPPFLGCRLLKTMVSAVVRLRQPLVLMVLRRTVAKVLSMGLVVRRCFQCSAGKRRR